MKIIEFEHSKYKLRFNRILVYVSISELSLEVKTYPI